MIICKPKKTPEQALFDIFQSLKIESYKKIILQERYLSVLRNFHSRAYSLAYFFYISRVIVTVGSILVPAFLSIQGSTAQTQIYWATWIISLSVTISNGFMTLFKLDKKYFFINTTLEMLHSEGWQYIGLSGRYSAKDSIVPPTHENQFLIFFHMAEKIKMRQVEEEYWKFTDTSGVGNATNQKHPLITPTPFAQQGKLSSLPEDQKLGLETWVQDMNLGLQPRNSNISSKIDGKGKTSGFPRPSSKTTLSMREGLFADPFSQRTVVPSSQSSEAESPSIQDGTAIPESCAIPENTLIQVVYDESNVWDRASPKPRVVE